MGMVKGPEFLLEQGPEKYKRHEAQNDKRIPRRKGVIAKKFVRKRRNQIRKRRINAPEIVVNERPIAAGQEVPAVPSGQMPGLHKIFRNKPDLGLIIPEKVVRNPGKTEVGNYHEEERENERLVRQKLPGENQKGGNE
jgi:hypothetical protein